MSKRFAKQLTAAANPLRIVQMKSRRNANCSLFVVSHSLLNEESVRIKAKS